MKLPYHRLGMSFLLLLLTGLLFIPIRGGFTVSTMNTGKVYFSTNILLNHAATNPAFSLMESLSNRKTLPVSIALWSRTRPTSCLPP